MAIGSSVRCTPGKFGRTFRAHELAALTCFPNPAARSNPPRSQFARVAPASQVVWQKLSKERLGDLAESANISPYTAVGPDAEPTVHHRLRSFGKRN